MQDAAGIGRALAFSRDGRWLATSGSDGFPRLWPLPGTGSREVRTLHLPEPSPPMDLVFAPGDRVLFGAGVGRPFVAPLDGSTARLLEKPSADRNMFGVAVSPSGRHVATATLAGTGPERLAVWDLETGERKLFDLPKAGRDEGGGGDPSAWSGSPGLVHNLHFADEKTLYTAGMGGVRRWNLEMGTHELVFPTEPGVSALMEASADGQMALVDLLPAGVDPGQCTGFGVLGLSSGTMTPLPSFRGCPASFALDPSGTIAAIADFDGVLHVGRLSAEKPHLLFGHEGPVSRVAFSPDRHWIASIGEDQTLRLWPMPDLDRPPLNALPYDELLTRLRSLTNIRAVRDPASATGWSIALDLFPGWKEVPAW